MENTIKVSTSIEETSKIIYEGVVEGSITGVLIDQYEINGPNNTRCMVVVYEKHYYRAGNRLTLTVTLDNFEGNTRVHYVSGGGGEGLLRFDWWASESFADIVPKVLNDYMVNDK